MQNKKILLFTYYWPPAAGPGVQRWLKFCKFLGEFGFSITVVTPKQPSASNYDDTLVDEIPEEIDVISTKSFEPFELYKILKGKKGDKAISVGGIDLFNDRSLKQRIFNYIRANFFIPDARKGWNKFALREGRDLLKRDRFDLIITTGPPHSTHLIGKKLKEEFNIKWIADFRDPWINIYYNKIFPRTRRTKRLDQNLENSVLNSADAILAVSPGLQSEFQDRANRIEILYNGFDADDIPAPGELKNSKFHISYIGNFKPNQNCDTFWLALKKSIESGAIDQENVEVKLIGNVDQLIKSSINDNGLNELVSFENYKPHREATDAMVNTDALLFIIPKTEHNNLILTGKLFEYLASGSHMISIGPPEGNAAKIIEECGRGNTFDYDNEEAISNRLEELYTHWKSGAKPSKHTIESVQHYSRRGMTKRLAEVIKSIVK